MNPTHLCPERNYEEVELHQTYECIECENSVGWCKWCGFHFNLNGEPVREFS